jgi:AraC-like DNA-binding protein
MKTEQNKSNKKSTIDDYETPSLLLIIEDNPHIAKYIKKQQDQYPLKKTVELIPSIISDLITPDKNGFEIHQLMKNDISTRHIPIILLTAQAGIDSNLEGLGAISDVYLSKPFVKENLLIRVKKILERRPKLYKRFAKKSLFYGSSRDYTSSKSQIQESTSNELFLKKVYDLVHENLGEANFGNPQLANKMFLSESQLYRKIKALTGRSTAIHMRSIRLHKAKKLLLNSNLTVAEIAYETGFNNPSYFSRSFSKEFNMSPSSSRQ